MKKTTVNLGKQFFKIRGFTPIPFYLLCLAYVRIELNLLITGLLLIGLGEIFRVISVGYLGISSRTTESAKADELVMNGPYRIVRNPIYLGNTLIYLGFAVLSNVFFPVFPVITLVFFMVVYYLIAHYEESVLCTKFGEDYQNYLLRVPRFFPLSFRTGEPASSHRFVIEKALMSEKTTLIVLILALTLIVLKSYTH